MKILITYLNKKLSNSQIFQNRLLSANQNFIIEVSLPQIINIKKKLHTTTTFSNKVIVQHVSRHILQF